MRILGKGFVLAAVVLLWGSICTSADASDPVKIWCLGDSITEGAERIGTMYPSYRYELSRLLKEKGMSFDFVGTRTGPDTLRFPEWTDRQHDGWGGHSSEHILNGSYESPSVATMLNQVNPDIVLIHIGTNDSVYIPDVNDTIANLKSIITTVRGKNPDADFYVAQIIPIAKPELVSRIDEISAAIGAQMPSMNTASSAVTVVDMYTGYNLSWFSDGVHPDFRGEAFMAQKWADAINVPEPASVFLLVTGAVGVLRRRRG